MPERDRSGGRRVRTRHWSRRVAGWTRRRAARGSAWQVVPEARLAASRRALLAARAWRAVPRPAMWAALDPARALRVASGRALLAARAWRAVPRLAMQVALDPARARRAAPAPRPASVAQVPGRPAAR